MRAVALSAAVSAGCGSAHTIAARDGGSGGAGGSGGDVADAGDAATGGGDSGESFRVLLFSRTVGFRHDAIPAATATLIELGTQSGYVAESTEDPARFSAAGLAPFDVVVFLLTSGDVLNGEQQAAFEAWHRAGGGYVGIHSAADTEYDWPFYGAVVGAYFDSHPAIQRAVVRVERPQHPSATALLRDWPRTDEWYNFKTNPRAQVTVIATLDESTYTGGTMGADHPIAWSHAGQGGRAFYTAMGHTIESYADPAFREHLSGALRWAAHRAD